MTGWRVRQAVSRLVSDFGVCGLEFRSSPSLRHRFLATECVHVADAEISLSQEKAGAPVDLSNLQ